MSNGALADLTFYYVLKCELGYGKVLSLHSSNSVWQRVCSELEETVLGRSREQDFLLMQQQKQNRRSATVHDSKEKYQKPHHQQLKAKVVANICAATSGKITRDECLRRATCLPWLENYSLLQNGDVLMLSRLPINYDAVQAVYAKKSREHKRRKNKIDKSLLDAVCRSLLREPQPGATYHRNQQSIPCSTDDTGQEGDFGPRLAEFSTGPSQRLRGNTFGGRDLSEKQRLSAVVAHAGGQYGISREEQEEHERERYRRPTTRRTMLSRVPPDNYVCVRCNEPGHWVQFCPTRSDSRYDPRRVLSTNGISRNLLKRIEMSELDADFDGVLYRDQHGRFYVRDDTVEDRSQLVAQSIFDFANIRG